MTCGRFQGSLVDRSFEFGAAVLDVVDCIPNRTKGWVVAKQLASSGNSVGANISEADEALTEGEFIHRCGLARREASESRYWLRMCCRTGLLTAQQCEALIKEAHELVLILTAIIKKTQDRQERESK